MAQEERASPLEDADQDVLHTLALQQQIARLQALLESSRRIHFTIHLDGVLAAVLKAAVRELELDGASFSNYAASYGKPLPEDRELAGIHRFPIYDHTGAPLTELHVLTAAGRTLSLEETDFLENLAVQAAVAIENAAYHERSLQWERVQRDLAAARAIQLSLVPQVMPQIPGYGFGLRFHPCYEVGGDYLDILPYGNGEYLLVVADVAGKGLASALVGNAFRSALRAMAVGGVPLEQMAANLNDLHYREGAESRQRYLTAVFALLDPLQHTVSLVNAGHVPALLLPDEHAPATLITSSSLPIGMLPALPGMSYQTETHTFPPGARLLLCTDGLTEASCGGAEFRMEGIESSLRAAAGCAECDALLDGLWRDVLAFARGNPQEDDMSAMALIRHS